MRQFSNDDGDDYFDSCLKPQLTKLHSLALDDQLKTLQPHRLCYYFYQTSITQIVGFQMIRYSRVGCQRDLCYLKQSNFDRLLLIFCHLTFWYCYYADADANADVADDYGGYLSYVSQRQHGRKDAHLFEILQSSICCQNLRLKEQMQRAVAIDIVFTDQFDSCLSYSSKCCYLSNTRRHLRFHSFFWIQYSLNLTLVKDKN